jgi:glycosyltransferase involved in cell wall biosynthesis
MSERVIYIVRSWPRLSQTFILHEVLAAERRGMDLVVYSLIRSRETVVHRQVAQVRAPVRYLEDQLTQPWSRRLWLNLSEASANPSGYLRTLAYSLLNPGLASGYAESSTLRCFAYAVRIVAEIGRMRAAGDRVVRVHGHFAHDPALVGMLVSRLTGVPFSFTAHARDLVQIPRTSLAKRAAVASAVVTCCQENADYLQGVLSGRRRPPVVVIRHGVDLGRFRPGGRDPAVPIPRLVSVGRLVQKKGYVDLLHVLGEVHAAGHPFRCDIYGDGPMSDELVALRDRLGLTEPVRFLGAQDGDRIVRALHEADAFVLTPRVAADGDRDGIPNALVEAMASGLPVVTTSAGGVAELVENDRNGLICAPGDRAAMSAGLVRVLSDPALRTRLGRAARTTVEAEYDIDAAASRLERVLLPRRPTPVEVHS